MINHMHRARLPLVLCGLLAGCAVGPNYRRPELEAATGWRPEVTAASTSAEARPPAADSPRLAEVDAAIAALPGPVQGDASLLDTRWWGIFGDPKLDELIRIALAQNKDLQIAAYKIAQFDAYLQVSKSADQPQFTYAGGRSRETLSQNQQVRLSPGTQPVDNNFVASAGVTWAVDFWGKVSRSNEAALADLVASEEGRRALSLTLVGEVVTGYLKLLGLDRELELLKQNVKNRREALQLTETKFRDGGSSELPVAQAKSDLLQAQAEVPGKEAEIAVLENALSQLLGRNPGPIERGRTQAELTLPPVPAGLPSELLSQRPDVRKYEQELVAANARIGVAEAQYYPSISLNASSGFAADKLNLLPMLTSNFGSLGVAVAGPLFTSGRIAGQVREAEALRQQAAEAFAKSLQTAFHEAEDAFVNHRKVTQGAGLRKLQVSALREHLTLAQKRYEGGYAGYLEVLDADRSLTQGLLQDSLARSAQFISLVSVYKALGGGWSLPEVTASHQPQPSKTK
jgi:multidrug efflux system outer membrane protein